MIGSTVNSILTVANNGRLVAGKLAIECRRAKFETMKRLSRRPEEDDGASCRRGRWAASAPKGVRKNAPFSQWGKGDEGGPASPEGDVLSVGASRAVPVLALGLQLIDVNPY